MLKQRTLHSTPEIAPLVYILKHRNTDKIGRMFEEIWNIHQCFNFSRGEFPIF